MAKLSNLIPAVAKVTGVPQKTVNVTATALRGEGLLTTGGRGMGGAQMQPSDATNLLLGVMASSQVKLSPIAVYNYRLAALTEVQDAKGGTSDPHRFMMGDDEPLNLGEVLDRTFALLSRAIEMGDEASFPFDGVEFTVWRHQVGAFLSLWERRPTGQPNWYARYLNEAADRQYGGMRTETAVGYQVFKDLSACLAGQGQ